MKIKGKILLFIIIALILLITMSNKSYATSITAQQIADKINSSSDVAKLKQDGITVEATCIGDSIFMNFTCTMKSGTVKVYSSEYILKDNILTIKNENEPDIINFQLIMNVIGQVHGYKDGDIYNTLVNKMYATEEMYKNCTLEKDGLEYNYEEEIIKINVDKIIELETYSNSVFDETDFNKITEEGWYWPIMRKGDTILSGSTCVISISGDKESMYQSLLNILEVTYKYANIEGITQKEFITYFKENYPDLSIGSRDIYGIGIYSGLTSEYSKMYNQPLQTLAYQCGADVHGDALMVSITELDFEKIKEGIKNPSLNSPLPTINPIVTDKPIVDEPLPTTGTGDGNIDTPTPVTPKPTGGSLIDVIDRYPNAGLLGENLIKILIVLIVVGMLGIGVIINSKAKK